MMVGLFVKLSLPKVFFGESVRPPIKGDVLAKVNCQLSYRKKGGLTLWLSTAWWWLEPWNFEWLSRNSWEFHSHPNWPSLTHFFQRGRAQPRSQSPHVKITASKDGVGVAWSAWPIQERLFFWYQRTSILGSWNSHWFGNFTWRTVTEHPWFSI